MDNLNKKINNCFISVNIQKDDFDVNTEIKSIGTRKIIGGIANFIGVVRDSQIDKEDLIELLDLGNKNIFNANINSWEKVLPLYPMSPIN